MEYAITAFYHFAPITQPELGRREALLYELAEQFGIIGLVILATEGLNGTVAGTSAGIEKWKKLIHSLPGFADTEFKDSTSTTKPFRRFKVKRRDEIVSLGDPGIVPTGKTESHLAPSEWERVLKEENDFVLIDTRNTYETEVGKFKKAIDPRLKTFGEFSDWVQKSEIPKDKKVLMYCTGGIRCEKAYLEMKRQGYDKVYQLEGGILKYFEEYPNSEFDGECFVFDHRVALDQNLQPSEKYFLCPHSGDPATKKITCSVCGEQAVVSSACMEDAALQTCSKNCSHHFRRNNGIKEVSESTTERDFA